MTASTICNALNYCSDEVSKVDLEALIDWSIEFL